MVRFTSVASLAAEHGHVTVPLTSQSKSLQQAFPGCFTFTGKGKALLVFPPLLLIPKEDVMPPSFLSS